MKVMIKDPGQDFKIIYMNDLSNSTINGLLRTNNARIFGFGNNLIAMIDDNAYRQYLPFNMRLAGFQLCGPVIFVKADSSGFNGLSTSDIEDVNSFLKENASYER